jgi:hypothetical protein
VVKTMTIGINEQVGSSLCYEPEFSVEFFGLKIAK